MMTHRDEDQRFLRALAGGWNVVESVVKHRAN